MSDPLHHPLAFPSPPPTRRRSRRLRKKLRIGEFKDNGFSVRISLAESLSPKESENFWSAFIFDLIEARRLAFGGGEDGYITRRGRGSATEEDRDAVSAWLNLHPAVEQVVVGPLEDAWYGPMP